MTNVHKKRTVKRALKRFQRSKKENTEYRETYVSERKEYKQLLAKKKTESDRARTAKLKQSKKTTKNKNDPKLFWQTIRSVNWTVTIHNDITNEQWYDFFFQVSNTSALADTLTHVDKITDAETDEELPEAFFN